MVRTEVTDRQAAGWLARLVQRFGEWHRQLSYLKFRGLAYRPFTGKEKPWLITEVCSCYKISDPCWTPKTHQETRDKLNNDLNHFTKMSLDLFHHKEPGQHHIGGGRVLPKLFKLATCPTTTWPSGCFFYSSECTSIHQAVSRLGQNRKWRKQSM